MIKNIIILLVLIIICNISFSQDVDKNKWGFSFAINNIDMMPGYGGGLTYTSDGSDGFLNGSGEKRNKSYSFSIIPKYYLSDDLILRFEVGFTNIDMTIHSDVMNVQHQLYTLEVKQTNYRYVPGIEWNLVRKKKIELFGGILFSYIKYGNITGADSSIALDSATNVLLSWRSGKSIIPGGFSIGFGPVLRIQINLFKHFSIGAESSYSYIYSNVGGQTDNSYILSYNPSLPPQISSPHNFQENFKGFQFSKIKSSLNISITF